jgi:hypothetical protein
VAHRRAALRPGRLPPGLRWHRPPLPRQRPNAVGV